jgi:multicomponent Na+:H+ antiporter subunit E
MLSQLQLGIPKRAANTWRWLTHCGFLALIWLGLNGADGASWILGVPVVLAATAISVRLASTTRWRWNLRGALVFTGYFLMESLRGGWDVAVRALLQPRAFFPGLIQHRFLLPTGSARFFFCGVISLLPGTAVVAIEEDQAVVHVLDLSPQTAESLDRLELRVAALFGLNHQLEKGGRQ